MRSVYRHYLRCEPPAGIEIQHSLRIGSERLHFAAVFFATYSMETSDHVPINRDRDACCDPASRPGNTSKLRNASPPAIGARCNFIAQSREYYVSPQSSPTTAIMIIHCYPNTLFAGAEQCAAPILPKRLRLRQSPSTRASPKRPPCSASDDPTERELRSLEERLGVRLLNRTTRSVSRPKPGSAVGTRASGSG